MTQTLVSTVGGAYSTTELSGKTHVGALARVISSRHQVYRKKKWLNPGKVRNLNLVFTARGAYSTTALPGKTRNSCFSNILYVSDFLKLNRGQIYVMVGNQTMVSSVSVCETITLPLS